MTIVKGLPFLVVLTTMASPYLANRFSISILKKNVVTLAVSFDNASLSHRHRRRRSPSAVSLFYHWKNSPCLLVFRMP